MSLDPTDNSGHFIARPSQIERISEELRIATAALQCAGFTRCENGNWKPPLGKPVQPILDSLDAERKAKTVLKTAEGAA